MVDHLAGHAAVDADVLAGEEARLLGAEVEDHIGNVQRIAHPARRLLDRVRAFPDGVPGVDPPGGDGVYPHLPRQAHRQGMGQGGNTALGRRVAFGLGLAHPVPGGGDVHDGRPGGEVGGKQLGQVKGRSDPHPQGAAEFLVAALVQPFHQGRGVVDEVIHVAAVGYDLTGKVLENGLVAQVSHVILVGQNVDAAHPGPCIAELFRNGFSNPLCAAGDDGDPILKHNGSS